MKKIMIILFLVLLNATGFSQKIISVFLDSKTLDFNYIREKIDYINYVNEMTLADLVIYESSETTGSQGQRVSLFFEGQQKFKNVNDTLIYLNTPTSTSDERRENSIKYINLGMIKYLLLSNNTGSINISLTSTEHSPEKIEEDEWKNWSQYIRTNFYFNANQNYSAFAGYLNLQSQKITKKNKIIFNYSTNYRNSLYKMTDNNTYKAINSSHSFYNLLIFGIDEHWSFGENTKISTSTYSNNKFLFSIGPQIEYNIYPYSMATNKQLRINYGIQAIYNNYIDTTIFNKNEEILYSQNLSINSRIIQKWGYIDFGINWENYLHNFKYNSLWSWSDINVRLLKNLSISLYGSGGLVRNQLNIPKGSLSQEEILLQLKEQQSSFSISYSAGLTYRFGSINNNIVNPRFGD